MILVDGNLTQSEHLKFKLEIKNNKLMLDKDDKGVLCQIKKHATIMTQSLKQGTHY